MMQNDPESETSYRKILKELVSLQETLVLKNVRNLDLKLLVVLHNFLRDNKAYNERYRFILYLFLFNIIVISFIYQKNTKK